MPLLMCPNDNAPMQTLDRNGVQFDMCPTCRGVWLDRGELEKLMDAATEDGRASVAQAPAPAPQPQVQYQAPPPQPQHQSQPWGQAPSSYGQAPYGQAPYGQRPPHKDDRRREDEYHYRKKKKRMDIFDIFD